MARHQVRHPPSTVDGASVTPFRSGARRSSPDFQGEALDDNSRVGKFNLDEAQPAPRGAPQIEVTSSINAIDSAWNSDLDSAFSLSDGVDTSVAMCMLEVMTEQLEGTNQLLRQLGSRGRVGILTPYSQL